MSQQTLRKDTEASTSWPGEDVIVDLDVSVVMPCLNESESVAFCVRQARGWIERSGLRGEVLVVDNGSDDGSAWIAERAGARVVFEDERGYGAACIRGLEEARGACVLMGDADGTYDFDELDPMYQPLQCDAEIVLGNRLTGKLDRGAMPFLHRTVGTPVITFLLSLFSGYRVGDSQCGLRGIRKDAFLQLGLKAKGMEFASEMLLKAVRRKLRIAEVPITYRCRAGESKLSTFRDGWRHLRLLLLSTPTYAFVVPAFVFLSLGLLSLVITLLQNDGIKVGSLHWQPVFAGTIFLVVGTNASLLGLASKLFAAGVHQEQDLLVRTYRRYLGFEGLLLIGAALAALGVAVDGLILVRWLMEPSGPELLRLAALGQTLLIIGGNVAFGSVAVAIIDNSD